MNQASKTIAKTGVGGFFARAVWNAVTDNEDHNAQAEAERRVAKETQTSRRPSLEQVLNSTEREKTKLWTKMQLLQMLRREPEHFCKIK